MRNICNTSAIPRYYNISDFIQKDSVGAIGMLCA